MVSKLEYFVKDPNGLKRGKGYYYLRGGKHAGKFVLKSGLKVKGAYYSKYSAKRDTAKLSTGWRVNKIGTPPKVAKKYAHVTDGVLTKRVRR